MSTGRSKENSESKDYNLKDWIISSNLKSSSMNDELCTSNPREISEEGRKTNSNTTSLVEWVHHKVVLKYWEAIAMYCICESKRDETRRAFTWNTNATKEGWRRRLKLQTPDPGSSSYYSGSSSIYNVPKIQDHPRYSDYGSSSDGR
jgi:hypothetical protein